MKKIFLTLLLCGAALCYSAHTPPSPTPPPTEEVQSAPSSAPTHAAPQAPTPLPSSEQMTTSYENAFIRMLVTLLGILALVFATFWILRRLGTGKFKMGASGRTINIIEKRALSPKSMLYIVEIENKRILISESQLEVRALSTCEEPPPS